MRLNMLFLLWAISLPTLSAAEIKVAASLTLAPYVIKESNKGIEIDILRAALKTNAIEFKVVYLPFARIPRAIDNKTVDAALTINRSHGIPNVYYSDSHITYQNVAVCLSESNIKIDTIQDLKDHSIVAFQKASVLLGSTYKSTIENSPYYAELADQTSQLKMLFAHRVDCIVLDLNIFKYYRQLVSDFDAQQKVDIFRVFPETKYSVGFRQKQYRDDFNAGLKQLKQSGGYQQILDRYIDPLN